jgi:hypothetical protein
MARRAKFSKFAANAASVTGFSSLADRVPASANGVDCWRDLRIVTIVARLSRCKIGIEVRRHEVDVQAWCHLSCSWN